MLARPKMGAAPPLLTLRDLLELACESSCSDGFRSYPRRLPWHGDDAVAAQAKAEAAVPVRLLITAGLRRSPSRTLSSILFHRSPRSLAAVSRLTRSLSRRLVFWRRHSGDEDGGSSNDDSDERDSLSLPSPVVSSCSASECAGDEPDHAYAADLLAPEGQASIASDGSSEKPSPSTSSGCTCTGSVDDCAADGDGHKEALDGDPVGSSMEEKQQLSPVSVMDFPFHNDDEDDDGDERSDAGTCSPSSFQQCQPERSNPAHELLHKVRRLDGLAQAAVDPVDLEPRFVIVASDDSAGESDDTTTQAQSNSSISTDDSAATASSDEKHHSADDAESEPDAHRRLLAQLLDHDGDDKQAAVSVAATERLLLDFFAEGLDQRRSPKPGPVVGTVKMPDHDRDEPALVRAAREWLQGLGTQWGVEDVLFSGGVALAVADMDRERRWTCFAVEEPEVGVAVEGLVMDALVAELVSELAARC